MEYNNTKAVSLVFEYDFDKQKTSGRVWGKQGYRSKDFIFEYSAASFSTFAHHNSKFYHEVLTDDRDLLWKKISKYDVDWSYFHIIEDKDLICEWKNHRYCFYPAMMHLGLYKSEKCQLLKLDNDLECLRPLDSIKNSKDYLFWKFERNVSSGRDYWGESYAARLSFGTDNFPLYNMGVLGFPEGDKSALIDKMIKRGIEMSQVDISSIARFREDPAIRSKIWSCSEQTAYCYVMFEEKLNLTTVEDLIDHHCYGHDAKEKCIDRAKFLLKCST